jgi:hypothetical protein
MIRGMTRHLLPSILRPSAGRLANGVCTLAVTAGAILAGVLGASAQTPPPEAPSAQQAALPPLVDRELFFCNPEISGAMLSPDGQYVALRKPWNGTLNIWV